jgi:hypothetical protein
VEVWLKGKEVKVNYHKAVNKRKEKIMKKMGKGEDLERKSCRRKVR